MPIFNNNWHTISALFGTAEVLVYIPDNPTVGTFYSL